MGGRSVVAVSLLASGCALAVSTSEYAGGSGDAGTDARTDAGGDGGSFCSGHTSDDFCADFAAGYFEPKEWSAVTTTADGALHVEQDSLVATVGKTSNKYPAAFVAHDVSANRSVHMEGDVYVAGTDDGSGNARIFGFQFHVNALVAIKSDGTLQLTEDWAASDGSVKFAYHGAGKFPLKTWFHLAVDLDVTTKTVTAAINGATFSDGSALAGPFDASGSPDAVVGLYYAETDNSGWAVRFDNVVIDEK